MRALNRGFEIETRPVVAKRPPAGACNCEETNDANFYFYSCVVMVSDGVSFAFAQQPRYVVSPFAPFFNYGSRSSGPIPRTVVDFQSSYAPGTIFIDTTERRLYLVIKPRPGYSLRHWRGSRWLRLGRRSPHQCEAGMAELVPAIGNARPASGPAAFHARWPRQSPGRASPVPWIDTLSNSRLE